jgi:hypothetical protein
VLNLLLGEVKDIIAGEISNELTIVLPEISNINLRFFLSQYSFEKVFSVGSWFVGKLSKYIYLLIRSTL